MTSTQVLQVSSFNPVSTTETDSLNVLELLHLRLGHKSERNIKLAVKHGLFAHCPITYDKIKKLRLRRCFSFPRKPSTQKEYEPLECIAVDYKEPIGASSVHHWTEGVWVYPCTGKEESILLPILRQFFMHTVDPSRYVSRIFHCDYDTVLTGGNVTEYLDSQRLKIAVSVPYSHYQNGQVERAMQTVLDKARVMLAASQAPCRYWDYAVQMAAYLIVRSPNSTNSKTPYETSVVVRLQTFRI